jgi:broad specificity phosphatase PhoE
MAPEKSVKGSFRSLVSTLRSWQKRKKKELRYAIVRHAERADSCWHSDWCFSKDAQAYPFDPPLTPNGVHQARACGARLQQLEPPQEGWSVVICSPFLRCLQTAVEICKATGASLIIDEGWGEVRFREMLETEMSNTQQGLTRPYQFLARYVEQEGVKLRNPDAPCGNVLDEKAPESLQDARVRYARKFVLGLDRAMLSQSSVIVVSHGESLPGCLPLFKDYRNAEVISAPFCGMVVGRLEQPSTAKARSVAQLSADITGIPTTSDASAMSGILDGLSVIEMNCEVRQLPAATPTQELGRLPAWMRSRKVKFRAGSAALMQALGIYDSGESRSRELPQTTTQSSVTDRPSFRSVDNMIECEEVTKFDDDFDYGNVNLVELPAVPPRKEVSGSSSQMHCIVGASTLLLGDFVVGLSSTCIESESIRSLKYTDQITPPVEVAPPRSPSLPTASSTWSDNSRENIPRRRRTWDSMDPTLSPRGVKGPTQLRAQRTHSGCARRVGRRGMPQVEGNLSESPCTCFSDSNIEKQSDFVSTGIDPSSVHSAPPYMEESALMSLRFSGVSILPVQHSIESAVKASDYFGQMGIRFVGASTSTLRDEHVWFRMFHAPKICRSASEKDPREEEESFFWGSSLMRRRRRTAKKTKQSLQFE